MILIADSGSTKTDWCIVFNDTPIKRIGTKGINPFFQSEEEIQQELTHSLLPQLPEGTINSVFFYGAAADLVISRAGAGSISEFCLLHKPVILVPSPNVAEDHQTKNALALVNKQAAIYVKDSFGVF